MLTKEQIERVKEIKSWGERAFKINLDGFTRKVIDDILELGVIYDVLELVSKKVARLEYRDYDIIRMLNSASYEFDTTWNEDTVKSFLNDLTNKCLTMIEDGMKGKWE